MNVPTDRKYAETHEWFLLNEGNVIVGITQYAADEFTDITYVELPEVGRVVAVGDEIGEIESVKATSELFTAVAGTIVEVNQTLAEHPELINEDPFDEGWIVKVKVNSPDPLKGLLDAKAYSSIMQGSH